MPQTMHKRLKLIFPSFFLCCSYFSFAQPTDELYKAIRKMDSLYFTAQNNCDLEKYASFLSEDLEFFHDKAGFTPSKQKEMEDMAVFCGDEQRKRQPLRRELAKGSLKVFAMDKYGALEFCDHIFYLQIKNKKEKKVGTGRMVALWKLEGKEWKFARIISYDHQPLAEVELPDEILNKYIGDYVLPDRIVNIRKEGKLLRVTDVNDGKPGWTKELFPESENMFYLNYENCQYEFISKGSALVMQIYENDKLIETAKRK
jgi:ketosteroid isomerase-like protein